MKIITWTGKSGNIIELRATYAATMADELLDADGDKIPTGKKIKQDNAKLELYVDGQYHATSRDTMFWSIVDVPETDLKRIWGLPQMAMTAEQAAKVQAWLNDVIAAGTSADVDAWEHAAADRSACTSRCRSTARRTDRGQTTTPDGTSCGA